MKIPSRGIQRFNKVGYHSRGGAGNRKPPSEAAFLSSTSEGRREPLAGPAGDFGKLIEDETEKWVRVVKFAAIALQ